MGNPFRMARRAKVKPFLWIQGTIQVIRASTVQVSQNTRDQLVVFVVFDVVEIFVVAAAVGPFVEDDGDFGVGYESFAACSEGLIRGGVLCGECEGACEEEGEKSSKFHDCVI